MSVQIENLTKKYDHTYALNNVSLTIEDGEFLAILGPSGCGKTTLLRSIAGFIAPTEGEIKINSKIYSSPTTMVPVEERNLGMVFQSFALWPHKTVLENIRFPLESRRNKHLSQEEKTAAVNYALEATGLKGLTGRRPEELSGGQKQRVAVARAIVEHPSILLMDEPLSALDAELRISMRKEIQDIHKLTGATIIYVTHDQSEALAMADRILIMKDGIIEQIGTPEDIYYRPESLFVAVFVSKCNLIPGTWDNESFFADNSVKNACFATLKTAPVFKQKNVLPVRPEQLTINSDDGFLKGMILNCQWGGRELQYTVQCQDQLITVYTELNEVFNAGDEVYLSYKL